MIKYEPTNFAKDCPFGFSHQKDCSTCKLGIPLSSPEEIVEERKKGNYQIEQKLFTCIFVAQYTETISLKLKISEMIKRFKEFKELFKE